jgi:hypothetical protein
METIPEIIKKIHPSFSKRGKQIPPLKKGNEGGFIFLFL